MDAGALDRRLEVLRAAPVDDGFGTGPALPILIGTVWAGKRDVSDRERFANGTTEAGITTRFHVRWSAFAAAIRASDTLRCDGRAYGIVGIKEVGRHEGFEITAQAEGV